MQIKALALTLPNPEKLFVMKSQRANNPQPLEWDEVYRDQLFSMQELVASIARETYTGPLSSEQREALYNPDLTPRKAEEAITCVWVDADSPRKSPAFLDITDDSVTQGGLAGYDVPGGMRRIMLINNGVGATLTRDVVTELERLSKESWTCFTPEGKELPVSRYEPGFKVFSAKGEVNFDSLEMRSSNLFINQLVRFGNRALTEGKTTRLVTIPFEPKVSLIASKGREVLRERPRQWS